MKNRITENSPVLFENMEVIREMERFFIAAVAAANDADALQDWR